MSTYLTAKQAKEQQRRLRAAMNGAAKPTGPAASRLTALLAAHGALVASGGLLGAAREDSPLSPRAAYLRLLGVGTGVSLGFCAALTATGGRARTVGIHLALLIQVWLVATLGRAALGAVGDPQRPLLIILLVGSAAALAGAVLFKPKKEKAS